MSFVTIALTVHLSTSAKSLSFFRFLGLVPGLVDIPDRGHLAQQSQVPDDTLLQVHRTDGKLDKNAEHGCG